MDWRGHEFSKLSAAARRRGEATDIGRCGGHGFWTGGTLAGALALKPKPSLGFIKLVEFGMADMSAEALVLKYRNEFEQHVIDAATKRLIEYDIRV